MDSRGCFSVDPDKMVTNPKKMMKVGLQIKANLENVTGLIPENVQEFCWHLKLKCTECDEIPDHWQYVTLSEEQPLKPRHPSQTPPRGKTNFTSKCKLCSYQNTLDIKEDTIVSYDAEDVNNFKTIVVFSCRGFEPVDFDPKDGWQAHGYTENVDSDDSEGKEQSGKPTSTVFSDIDLSEKEWADFDEESGKSTLISEFEIKFVQVKN